jgi:hypothetical protein
MKNNASPPSTPPRARTVAPHAAGTYLGCGACGRLLKIHWPTRSVICSCGAKVTPPSPDADK